MYLIGFALALAGLIIIFMIVGKKFSLLANIDLNQIAAERQSAVKRRIINEKFKRNWFGFWSKVFGLFKPFFTLIAKFFTFLYNKLVNLKASYEVADKELGEDAVKRLAILFAEAEDLIHKQELIKAEAKYIEIIGLDSKNHKAFAALGDLYFNRGNYQEAEQTIEHSIKLAEQQKKSGNKEIKDLELAKAYFSLGAVAAAINDNLKSLANIKKSLEIEPNSPRYLDKACEICLNLRDSVAALEYCRKLEQVNPGNKKLKDFKERIKELASATDNQVVESSVHEVDE